MTAAAQSSVPLILVTGATDGIGNETAFQLARLGARVIVHGRTVDRANAAVADLRVRLQKELPEPQTPPALEAVAADFSSLAEVRRMAGDVLAQHPALDVLINNAGVYVRRHALSVDGFELTFAVNHLAPFLLSHLLLPALEASGAGRIVNVSSVAHLRARPDWSNLRGPFEEYDDYDAYARSKLAMVMTTVELARRLRPRPVTVNSLHPGVVSTKLLREGFEMEGTVSLVVGAATSIYLALASDVAGTTGGYYVDRRPSRMQALAGDPAITSRLYALSAQLVGITGLPKPG